MGCLAGSSEGSAESDSDVPPVGSATGRHLFAVSTPTPWPQADEEAQLSFWMTPERERAAPTAAVTPVACPLAASVPAALFFRLFVAEVLPPDRDELLRRFCAPALAAVQQHQVHVTQAQLGRARRDGLRNLLPRPRLPALAADQHLRT